MEIEQAEYERLMRCAEGNPKLCQGIACEFMQKDQHKKWSPSHFIVGLAKIVTSPEFYVFLIFTTLFIIFAPKDVIGSWVCLAVVAICFMFYKQIGNLINKGNLHVNANAGVGANINKTIGENR